MRPLARAALALLVASGGAWVWLRSRPTFSREPAPELELAPARPHAPFARATGSPRFQLPRDHGPHYDFATEWWYYTGNLAADDGRPFGFQLTFFRRGLSPGPPPIGPGLRTNQIYFAHLAVTDAAGRRHQFFERWSRGAAGLAGADAQPFAVWLEGWTARAVAPDGASVRLRAHEGDWGIDLTLAASKPLVLHGDHGLSSKGADPGNASYYVGYTRMGASGQVSSGGPPADVRGTAWFDHEWSTSALGEGAVGWDWFSLQLGDEREVMFFVIRRGDGSLEPASSGTLVEKDGRTRRLAHDEVTVEVLDRWTSPESGATYPVRWRIASAVAEIDLEVDRRLDAQELRTSFTYWEGAVAVKGRSKARPVDGAGYVELTGYAGSMRGVF